jgi:hypothetical protein
MPRPVRNRREAGGTRKPGKYVRVIERIFLAHYKPGANRFEFRRQELASAARQEGVKVVEKDDEYESAKNLGDIVYTFRFRRDFPPSIKDTAPRGKMWVITGKGDARYEFRLITIPSLAPDPGLFVTKLHDATPEIVRRFKLSDEQALLARIRYNRLVDYFCRAVAHSLQNHLRTKLKSVGQIEIDELYVAANRQGQHFVIPIQAKKKKDRLGVSQLLQDLEYCRRSYPDMKARAIGAQMQAYQEEGTTYDNIVLIEFEADDRADDIVISKVAERHFVLMPYTAIGPADFAQAASRPETSAN